MSEQDAPDTDDGGQSEPGEASKNPESAGTGQPESAATDDPEATDDLAGIAQEPDGDPDSVLADILGEKEDTEESDPEEVPVPDVEDVDDRLLEQVRTAPPETTAQGIAMLRTRLEELERELGESDDRIADLESRLKRKQADFQNYKRRQKERLEEEKQRATEDLVSRLLDVRDNLTRALEQDEDTDIRSGVESTLRQFDEQLERENVEPIEPEPGEAVDPQRHETLATIAAEQPADTIARLHRPGYEMAGKVIRPAQVAVSDGSQAE